MKDLINRIKERANNPATINDFAENISPKPQIGELVPMQKLEALEKELGFKFPEILKRVYTEIGNGGFGPGYGLYSLEESVEIYKHLMSKPECEWEKGTFPLCTWGCNIDSFVDCIDATLPVYFSNDDEENCLDSDYTYSIVDEHGNEVSAGSGSSIDDILGKFDSSANEQVLDVSDEDDEDYDDEEIGLLYHKDSIDEWFSDWTNGIDLWSDMMGEYDEEVVETK